MNEQTKLAFMSLHPQAITTVSITTKKGSNSGRNTTASAAAIIQ
jgi:hypothetical protein